MISITDHDTVGGLEEGRRAANEAGIRLVNGIEITAIERGKDVHVLGYFFDSRSSALLKFLEGQRQDRIRRIREMAARLQQLGCPVEIDSVIESVPPGEASDVRRSPTPWWRPGTRPTVAMRSTGCSDTDVRRTCRARDPRWQRWWRGFARLAASPRLRIPD